MKISKTQFMEISGKPSVNPWLFYSGKTAGYLTWVALLLAMFNSGIVGAGISPEFHAVVYVMLIVAFVIILLAGVYLGRSTRIGLPTKKTVLKTNGIYRISRNPMYLGVHLVTLAAMLYTFNFWVALAGIYSFVVYHQIVLSEELFLENRFGAAYLSYKQKVRRYI